MANVKISGLPAASSVVGTNEFEINEAGTSKKVTGAQIAAYANSLVSTNSISQGNTSVTATDTGTDGKVVINTEGTDRVTVDSSGNVGIGTNDTLGWDVLINRTGENADLAVSRTSGALTALGAGATEGGLYTETNHPLVLGTNDTERMRITSDGNVGIGTGSPGSILELNRAGSGTVGPNLYLENSASSATGNASRISFGIDSGSSASSPTAYIENVKDSAGLGSSYLAFGTFGTSLAERMRIRADGNIEVGTSGGSGARGLDAYSETIANGENAYLGCYAKSGASNWRYAYMTVEKHSGITNPAGAFLLWTEDGVENYIWVDNSDILRISTTRAHIGTTSGTVVGAQTSDERLKNISGPVEYGLPEIMALEPIAFTMKNDESESPKIGFSAQQVQPIIPEAVFDTKIEIEEGQLTKLGMEYTSIIPVLVKAIQEQQGIITALTARIEALENA